jgi:hypothetical protein
LYDRPNMEKIASPAQLTHEARKILAYAASPNPSRDVIARQLVSLANRVSGGVVTASMKPLYGHTDENSAYVVDDYPYGFKLRTQIRYWLESTKGKGARFVSQTMNPKTGRWNAPKKSTYSMLGGVMYLDDKDHVQWTALDQYTKGKEALDFLSKYPQADLPDLKVWAKAKIRYLERYIQGALVMTINGQPVEKSEEEIGEMREDLKQWEEVASRAR